MRRAVQAAVARGNFPTIILRKPSPASLANASSTRVVVVASLLFSLAVLWLPCGVCFLIVVCDTL